MNYLIFLVQFCFEFAVVQFLTTGSFQHITTIHKYAYPWSNVSCSIRNQQQSHGKKYIRRRSRTRTRKQNRNKLLIRLLSFQQTLCYQCLLSTSIFCRRNACDYSGRNGKLQERFASYPDHTSF
ncbi:uncharacterized protein DS421_9g280880 [Arachis hypogaea]|nr:uncharacterized protein DS421_9g280880 [Arachis hypogaea]